MLACLSACGVVTMYHRFFDRNMFFFSVVWGEKVVILIYGQYCIQLASQNMRIMINLF